jgi:hypothetical protein
MRRRVGTFTKLDLYSCFGAYVPCQKGNPTCIIEFRIIYLQSKQLGLLPESHHQGGSAAHPLERAASMQAQLRKGVRPC